MQASDIPAKFNIPFGNAAGPSFIRSVPQASQIGTQDGAASLTDGFPPLCFIPPSAGGTPPWGQDFNGLLNQMSAWSRWQNAGGTVPYDATFQTAVGGYPAGAVVSGAGSFWLSIADNNTTDPTAGGAGWVPFGSSRPARIVTASTTLTLLTTDFRVGLRRTAGVVAMDVQLVAIPVGASVRISDLIGNFNAAPVRILPPSTHDLAGANSFTMNVNRQSAEFAYFGSLHWDIET